jgi:hypothetical protein
LVLAATIFAGSSQASVMVFSTGATTLGGSPINASAEFDFDPTNHRITIYLLNLQQNPADITSVLGSIRFTVSGAGANPTGTVQSSSFATFDIQGSNPGKGTPIADPNSPETNTWNYIQVSGTQMALCTTCAAGGNNNLIIGGPNASGVFSAGNGSIYSHQPFILGSGATYASGALQNMDSTPYWVINVPTETPAITVSAVIFGFGTATNFGANSIEVDTFTTPEPGPLVCVFAGLGLIGLGAWKRRSRQE